MGLWVTTLGTALSVQLAIVRVRRQEELDQVRKILVVAHIKGMAQRHHGGIDVVGAGVPPDAGLRRRVVRLLLLVVVFETLGKKGHGDTLGIEGTTADEREGETNQQDQQRPASNV